MAVRLELREVSFSYPLPGEGETAALDGVNLTVKPGEVLCVGGTNGSGKSTLAQVCAGLLEPTGGLLVCDGEVISGRSARRRLRREAGLLFQSAEDQLFAETVWKDVSFGPRNKGLRGRELDRAVREAAGLVDLPLEDLESRSPFNLSVGEKRRVALAGVLATDPGILILDEPFIGLDASGRNALVGSLSRYREKGETTMLIVTHDLSDAWSLADRFAVLSAGRLRCVETMRDLVSGEADLGLLGLRLPQWGRLARELVLRGGRVVDPADPRSLAEALVELKETSGAG